MRRRISLFDITIYGFIIAFALLTIYPFLNIASISISKYSAYLSNPTMIFPHRLTLSSYKVVFDNALTLSSYKNTFIITIVGTALSMILTILTAYPISRKDFKAKPFIVLVMVVTMLFNGGLIPNFYLVRSLGMYNTLWALIIPGSLSTYNVILLITFFRNIPEEISESATIDGASDFHLLIRIILPISMAILATLTLFYAVGRWNSFFNAIIYIKDREKWTIQLLMREVIMSSSKILSDAGLDSDNFIPTQNTKYATIFSSILPILALYPFLQKFFIKGVMVGAIKG